VSGFCDGSVLAWMQAPRPSRPRNHLKGRRIFQAGLYCSYLICMPPHVWQTTQLCVVTPTYERHHTSECYPQTQSGEIELLDKLPVTCKSLLRTIRSIDESNMGTCFCSDVSRKRCVSKLGKQSGPLPSCHMRPPIKRRLAPHLVRTSLR
jgi:hypothetical protein